MDKKFSSRRDLELWGGIECSYNRVRSKYFDQLRYNGHDTRTETDIGLFAELGIKVIRYPVIWEKLQSKKEQSIDWSVASQALHLLRERGITPIAGLVHHGSGPKHASLQTDSFASGLESFSRQVAEKFPWIKYYTPVNEPLTTARFCGLYGIWYPHKRNDKTFVKILLNEMKAVVLSMREIRKVNAKAKLVQTEDLAKVYSTPFMKYQADFENVRRWLPFDILCGKLNEQHPLWKYFLHYSDVQDLYFFLDNPCPPDIIGLDYYPTSERYLDENVDRYPMHYHGRNHKHTYADVEAIRVRLSEPSGPKVLIKEAWNRYQIPIAITECHIHCDYDSQIKWFAEMWQTCKDLRDEGADIRAVTSWALLGSFGWNRLLTAAGGDYESGAFDVSTGVPSKTPVAEYLKMLSENTDLVHPAELKKGWWQEESRYRFENLFDSVQPLEVDETCITR